jgi:glycosyltransferase involved in cell wall biosynthesis
VVIPTLGRPTLRHALGALVAQRDAEAFTVIVVHGPEVAAEAIRALVAPTPVTRFETLVVSERSVGARRNAGVAASSSPWIAFTDDDCRVPARWIAQLAHFRRDHPDIDMPPI